MNMVKRELYWSKFLKDFSEQNGNRPSRLGVFEDGNDYWIEDGLPFTGIDMDTHSERPTIEIMLKDFTHTVKNVRNLKMYLSLDGDDDGLDITDVEDKTTILRFEKF